MNFKEIQDLIKLVNKLDLTEFKLRDGEFELSIRTKHYGKAKIQTSQPATPTVVPVSPVAPAFTPTAATPAAPTEAPAETAEAAPQPAEEKSEPQYQEIRSPMVGTFYRAPAPDKPPYLKVGDKVEVGSVVCIVEAMKLFNEIESEISGRVVKVMAEDASPVEYDQVLFLIDPNG